MKPPHVTSLECPRAYGKLCSLFKNKEHEAMFVYNESAKSFQSIFDTVSKIDCEIGSEIGCEI